jgi:putative hydroxymethylpyrimidine transport system substrate-binding protein
VPPADPNAPPRLVAAGQGDLALSYQPVLHLLAQENIPVVRIGTLIDTPLTTLVVLKDGPIKSLKDLKGKKVGYSISGFEEATLGAMLKTVDLDMKDVSMVNVNFQLVTSLMGHQVDAVLGAYRNFEVNEMKEHKVEPLAFFPEENGVPMYDELILLANKDKLSDPRFPKFLAAVDKATHYLLNHPDECWAMFIKDHPDLNNSLNKTAWSQTLSRFAKRPGSLDTRRYEAFADFLLASGVIKSKPPLATYAVELK